jgi:hypothetical protein
VQIRDNWTHWTEFMNHVTHRFNPQSSQQREQQLYEGGFNTNAPQTQPQPVGQTRGNMVYYTCESPEHMSAQCPLAKEIDAKGIAYWDRDVKQWCGERETTQSSMVMDRRSRRGQVYTR